MACESCLSGCYRCSQEIRRELDAQTRISHTPDHPWACFVHERGRNPSVICKSCRRVGAEGWVSPSRLEVSYDDVEDAQRVGHQRRIEKRGRASAQARRVDRGGAELRARVFKLSQEKLREPYHYVDTNGHGRGQRYRIRRRSIREIARIVGKSAGYVCKLIRKQHEIEKASRR